MTERSALSHFLMCYWHEAMSDMYPSIEDAVAEFIALERTSDAMQLCDEIATIVDQVLYAESAQDTLDDPRLNKFWEPYT